MLNHLRPALVLLAVMTVLTGFAYPLAMNGLAAVAFPAQARSSLVERDGVVVGSALIGQNFAAPGYFHPRPSAVDYNAASSGASNLGPTNAALLAAIGDRTSAFVALNGVTAAPIDAVTASASGLDPDVSPKTARAQVARVAAARGADPAAVRALVDAHAAGPLLGIFGAARVNVLALNLDLDAALPIAANVAVD